MIRRTPRSTQHDTRVPYTAFLLSPAPDFCETSGPGRRVELDAENPYTAALQLIREQVAQRLQGRRIVAVAHRVVHGGKRYFAPTRVTADLIDDLRSYIPLAPLHQPFPLEAMGILQIGRAHV